MNYQTKIGDNLYSIAEDLTIGGSYYAEAIARLNNIECCSVDPNINLVIPDNWLKSYYPNGVPGAPNTTVNPIDITLSTVDVTAKKDYTIYLLLGFGLIVLLGMNKDAFK